MDKKDFAKKIFSSEENSAASLGEDQLSSYSRIAKKMFHTQVVRPSEMMLPALSGLSTAMLEGIEIFKVMFFVNVLKIDMVYVVAINLLIGIWDVLNNPLMGIAYDKTRTRWGKARPYLIFSPIPFFLSTAILYCGAVFIQNDNTHDPKKIMFIFIVLFIQELFATIFRLPQGNITSLMTPNPKDRIAMGLLRNYIGIIGDQLIYTIFMPLQDLNRWGVTNISMANLFAFFGIAVFVIGSVTNVLMAAKVKERVILQPKPAPLSKSLFYILKNKYAMRRFVAELFADSLSNGGYNWATVTQLEIIGGAFLSQLAHIPYTIMKYLNILFVPYVTKKFEKNKGLGVIVFRFIAMVRSILQFLTGSLFIDKKWWFFGTFALFSGLDAADNAPSNVLEDEVNREIADYTEYVTGERPDGTFGLLSELIKKLTAPINAMMTIAMFKWSGYDPTQPMLPFQQGSKVVYRKVYFLWVAFSVIPNLIKTIPLFFYDIKGDKREKMFTELNERRALIADTGKDALSAEEEALIEAIADEHKNKSDL